MDSSQQMPPTGAMPRPFGVMAQMPPGGMMMPHGFPQYPMPGMMMMPSMAGMPQMAPMPPTVVNPQLTHMLAESARGGRASNVFFKTRLCNKWRQGQCAFGDNCTYAHGQHELRYIPPEVLAQLEREQRAAEGQAHQPPPPPHQPPPQPPQLPGQAQGQQRQPATALGAGALSAAAAASTPLTAPPTAAGPSAIADDGVNKSQLYYKTRLCIRFMQTGYCSRGAACTFAHGYEDLRLLEHNQPSATGEMPPGMATAGVGPSSSQHHQHAYQQQQQQQQGWRGAAAGGRRGGRHRSTPGGELPPAVARARAVSAMMGVGEASELVDASEIARAAEAMRNGTGLRGSAYADSAEELMNLEAE